MNEKDIFEIKTLLDSEEYSFLQTHKNLGKNVILLGLGGSYAYGTNVEGSDIDIRGIAINSKRNILIGHDFEQVVNNETDTVVYSLNKMISLLIACNPNTIEILGLKPEQYFRLTKAGKLLLDNKNLFLSRRAVNSFGGYANQQLYRLNQKAARHLSQPDLEEHIFKTLNFIENSFNDRYSPFEDDNIKLFVDKSDKDDFETEIFMDVNLSHYPLRDYCGMITELQTTVKQYGKIGKRNKNALEHNKITKHMMHLVRLYLMCFDILEKEEINTYRKDDIDFLMAIRRGDFIDKNNQPTEDFKLLIKDYEKRLVYDSKNTSLPDTPNEDEIYDLLAAINEEVVKN